MTNAIGRREFIRGFAGAALPLPVLPSLLLGRQAEAAGRPPLRLVVLQNRDGTFPTQFWPSVDANVQVGEQVWHTPLAEIPGPLSAVLGTELDPVRAKVNVINGLDYLCFAFHQVATWLCCSNTNKEKFGEAGPPNAGSAVDCIVEHAAGFYTSPPPLAALRIADGDRRGSFWRPEGGRIGTPILKPHVKGAQAVFDTVVSRARTTPGPATAPAAGPPPDKLVTDHLLVEYKRFLAQARLGAEDRRRVQQHYQLVDEWQKRVLAAEAAPSGAPAPACGTLLGAAPAAGGKTINRYDSYIDGIVAALACGVTRIATLYISSYDDDGLVRGDVHHSNSHSEYKNGKTPQENTRLWDGWIARRVATLVKKLDAVKEADGSTLLDNCVVVWGNEDGNGQSHSSEGIPVVMAGGAGGRLRTGYYLDYRTRPTPRLGSESPGIGWPLPAFWIAVMSALGVRPEEYMKQGDPGGFGQIEGAQLRVHKDVPARRSTPLPFLYRG